MGLQKFLDDQMQSNRSVAYIFIIRDGRILTHTFSEGVPVKLIHANAPSEENQGHLEKIISVNYWNVFARSVQVKEGFISRSPIFLQSAVLIKTWSRILQRVFMLRLRTSFILL